MNQITLKSLPPEIIEKILLDTTTSDIPCNEPWVCKQWTYMVLNPIFWIKKIKKLDIDISERIWSVLQEFENNIIVTCLYHACLFEEHLILNTPIKYSNVKLPSQDERENWWAVRADFDEMIMAVGILISRSLVRVEITLTTEKSVAFILLLKLLSVEECKIDVNDDYGFWNFAPRYDLIQMMIRGNHDIAENLVSFRGCLPSLQGIPQDIFDLVLSIGVDDQNAAIDPGFSKKNINLIKVLQIKAGTDVSKLAHHPIPQNLNAFVVSGLESSHMSWMIKALKSLAPVPALTYYFVLLSYKLDQQSSEQLMQYLSDEGINFDYQILCSSTKLNSENEKALNDLAVDLWGGDDDSGGFWLFENDKELIEFLAGDYEIYLQS